MGAGASTTSELESLSQIDVALSELPPEKSVKPVGKGLIMNSAKELLRETTDPDLLQKTIDAYKTAIVRNLEQRNGAEVGASVAAATKSAQDARIRAAIEQLMARYDQNKANELVVYLFIRWCYDKDCILDTSDERKKVARRLFEGRNKLEKDDADWSLLSDDERKDWLGQARVKPEVMWPELQRSIYAYNSTLGSNLEKVLPLILNPKEYALLSDCSEEFTFDDGLTSPTFWSNFWIEQPGSEALWKHYIEMICAHDTASKWKEGARKAVISTAASDLSNLRDKLRVQEQASSGKVGKVELLYFLKRIKGVALQVNVQMERDQEAVQYRDSFWDTNFEDEGNSRIDFQKYCQYAVGTIMSAAYAQTVLRKYVRGEQKTVVLAVAADMARMGYDPSLSQPQLVNKLMDNIRSKYFYGAEWPQIKAFAEGLPESDEPLKLCVVTCYKPYAVDEPNRAAFSEATARFSSATEEAFRSLLSSKRVEFQFIEGEGLMYECAMRNMDTGLIQAVQDSQSNIASLPKEMTGDLHEELRESDVSLARESAKAKLSSMRRKLRGRGGGRTRKRRNGNGTRQRLKRRATRRRRRRTRKN